MDISSIRAIIFDYGGTIDTDGIHWGEVLRQSYSSLGVDVDVSAFRNAYVHGERTLATTPLIKPSYNFLQTLRIKAGVQLEYLKESGIIPSEYPSEAAASRIAEWCYAYAQRSVCRARPVLRKLSEAYPLVMVTNFYGNMSAVLEDFRLREMFTAVVESSVVGVRKPDGAIFRLGVEATGFPAAEVAVVGDSYDKDIFPAASIGCPTVWLRKTGWSDPGTGARADRIITSFRDLLDIFII
jgi:putative hydrolase of the HAD superfamily